MAFVDSETLRTWRQGSLALQVHRIGFLDFFLPNEEGKIPSKLANYVARWNPNFFSSFFSSLETVLLESLEWLLRQSLVVSNVFNICNCNRFTYYVHYCVHAVCNTRVCI